MCRPQHDARAHQLILSTPYLIHIVSGNTLGVAERYAHDVCRHFHDLGWDTAAITRDVHSIDTAMRRAGIRVFHAPLGGVHDPASAIALASRLRRLDRYRDVVIHAYRYRDAFTALLARKLSRRKNIRVIVTRLEARIARNTPLYRRIYRNIDAHIFVSRLARDRFLSAWPQNKPPFNPATLHVMYFSLNTRLLSEPLPEPERGAVTAVYHGPVMEGEGLENLIDAMAVLRGSKIRLRIVGNADPDYADSLRNRAIARHVMDNIDWKKPDTDRSEDIRNCHFGVLPTTREAVAGYNNLLFLAAGKPQVATRLGAPLEFLQDNIDSLLVNPNNPSELAEAMRSLATDAKLRQRLGAKSLSNFNTRLAWPRFIGRLTKLYTKL